MVKLKRVFTVFVAIMLFAVCGFLAGCGNKYKKLSWEISYSITEGEDWVKVKNNNLELFYGENADIIADEDGAISTNLYIKATIKGVKSKDLSQIIVTNMGGGINNGKDVIQPSYSISNNGQISIPLNLNNDSDPITTKLNFREINSGKGVDINLNIAPKLKSISMNIDKDKLTTAVLGSTIQLNAQKTISYYPLGSTERDVKFSFNGVVGAYLSRYDSNSAAGSEELGEDEFVADNQTDVSGIIVSEDGYVTIPSTYNLTKSNYVLRVLATSTTAGVEPCYVDIYLVDGQNRSLDLQFNNSTGGQVLDSITLYLTKNTQNRASESASIFNKVGIIVKNDAILNNIYFDGLQTKNRQVKAKYTPKVYVTGENDDGNPVEIGKTKNGLKVTYGQESNSYVVEAVDSTVNFDDTRKLSFKYVLEGFENNDLFPTFSSEEVQVNLNYLANGIKADNLEDINPETANILDTKIYSTQKGILTSFYVEPWAANYKFGDDNNKIYIHQIEDSDYSGNLTFNGETELWVEQNDQVEIALDGSRAKFEVRARCVPEYFAGENVDEKYSILEKYITLTVSVEKVITASKVEAYASKDIRWTSEELDGAINLDFNNVDNFYLKVFYEADNEQNFEPSSVVLSVDSGSAIKFVTNNSNQVSSINLSQLSMDGQPAMENGQHYRWYKVVLAGEDVSNFDTFNISVKSGGGKLDLTSESDSLFSVRYVQPANGEFRVLTDNSDNNILIEDEQISTVAYAVAITGNNANFNLVDASNNNTSIKEIWVEPYSFASEEFYGDVTSLYPINPRPVSTFSFNPKAEYTQLLNVFVHYYALDNGVIKLTKNYTQQSQERKSSLQVQLAAFKTSNKIVTDADLNNLRIAYYEGYPQAGELSFNISSESDIKNEVHFLNSDNQIISKTGINELAVKFENNSAISQGEGLYNDEAIRLNVSTIENGKNVKLNLNKQIGADLFRLNIGALRLGHFVSYKEAQINVVGFEKATKISLFSDGMENNNLYKSFIDGTDKDINFEITALVNWNNNLNNNLTYTQLGYELYKYGQNDDGSLIVEDGVVVRDKLNNLQNISIELNYEPQQSKTSLTATAMFTATYNEADSVGGVYKLVIGTMDSYSEDGFETYDEITIFIGDGSVKNKFNISSAEDFVKINNNLSAHYVLTNDIVLDENFVPIGLSENNANIFRGSLTGQNLLYVNEQQFVETHSINLTLNLNKANEYQNEYLLGLFAYIGEGQNSVSNVSNLKLNVNVVGELEPNAKAVIGGVAAINHGRIQAVDVTISNSMEFNNVSALTFGGLVGRNYGQIDMRGVKVTTENKIGITTKAQTNNIGLIAGEVVDQNAEILGEFDSEKLVVLNYNVVANVDVTLSENGKLNFGFAVGKIESGKINKLLVGGNVSINNVSGTEAYVGMVGSAQSATVAYSAIKGANITNNAASGSIAGIIANSQGGNTINNSKVMFDVSGSREQSTITTFSSSNTDVIIAGVLVSESTLTDTLIYNTVETLAVSDECAINGSGTVAGLVYAKSSNSSNVSVSFANINLTGTTIYPISNISETNCYYLGKSNLENNKFSQNNNATNSYAIIQKDDALWSIYNQKEYKIEALEKTSFFEEQKISKDELQNTDHDGKNYYDSDFNKVEDFENLEDGDYYVLKDNWDENIDYYGFSDTIIAYDKNSMENYYNNEYTYYSTTNFVNELYTGILPEVITNWKINPKFSDIWGIGEHNPVSLLIGAKEEFIFNLPYLKFNGEALNLNREQDFHVKSVNDNKEIVSYSEEIDNNFVVIINFHTTGDPQKDAAMDVNNKYNTYDIVKSATNSGLLIMRDEYGVSLVFEIVEGNQYAEIVNYTQIKFKSISGNQPIRLRIYSAFSNKYEDVIFYTQTGVTSLSVAEDSNAVSSNGQNEYNVNVYVTSSSKNDSDVIVTLNAQNMVGLNEFNSIFDNLNLNVQNNISYSYTSQDANKSFLTFEQLGKDIVVSPDKQAIKNANANEVKVKYTISLMFNTSYYNNEYNQKMEYAKVDVTFTIYQAATEITSRQTNYKISVGSEETIEATLVTTRTGDVNSVPVPVDVYQGFTNPNHLILEAGDADSLYIDFSILEGENIFEEVKKNAKINSIIDWFGGVGNIKITKEVKEEGKINFEIKKLAVKNDFNYRYITGNIKLGIRMYAQSNQQVSLNLELTITPQQLNEIQIYNYKIRRNEIADSLAHRITIDKVKNDYNFIQPGSAGGLMVINLQPGFSNVDLSNLCLTSEQLGDTYIQFEQMLYDREQDRYITYINNDNIDNNDNNDIEKNGVVIGKRLAAYSERIRVVNEQTNEVEYKYIYTGTLYVRLYLSKFVVANQQIGVNFDINKISEDGTSEAVNIHQVFTTEFTTKVEPSFDGIAVGTENVKQTDKDTIQSYNSYLIQKNSTNNVVKLKIYGFEYNAFPTIIFKELNKAINEDFYTIGNSIDVSYLFNTDANNPPIKDSDGAYVIEILLSLGDINKPFIMETNLYVSLDGVGRPEKSYLIFHPTDYVLNTNDIRLAEVVNNEFRVNLGMTKGLQIVLTKNTALDMSELYNQLPKGLDILNLYQINGNNLSPETDYTIFSINEQQTTASNQLVVRARMPGSEQIRFSLQFYYDIGDEGGLTTIHFGTNSGKNIISRLKQIDFRLIVVDTTSSEQAPIAITNEDQFLAINETVSATNYILMADLTLTNYTPIDAKFSSFDGNNHIITIKSFASTNLESYGLFASLDYHDDGANGNAKTTLKNVIVSYQGVELDLSSNEAAITNDNGVVFGGLVANLNEGGIIYNCDVINLSISEETSRNSVSITMPNNSNAKITFGGMVGINNNGIITNSRVGTTTYLQIRENNGVIIENKYDTIPLTFNIGNVSEDINQFAGILGGFVGINSGRISSSYVQSTNIINYSKSINSKTAGFVAQNNVSGTISYSYVKSGETNNLQELAKGTVIENKSNGNVAGFAHLNGGEISNCFANVVVKSQSTFISGFVFENSSTGYIHECYSAATLNDNKTTPENNISEQPFVGYKDGQVLSYGKMQNVYYYNYNSNIKQVEQNNRPNAIDLNKENIQESKYLHGFAFVMNENNIDERDQGVWSYYEYGSYNLGILPELCTANNIAYSYRYYVSNEQQQSMLTYAYGYDLGSSKNPEIIRDVTDYNRVFGEEDENGEHKNYHTGYVRFINDLDFQNVYIPITSKNYTLGSFDAITSIEGNGMEIKNVRFSTNAQERTNEIGLFANVQNSYIKNLSIKLENEPSVGNTKYLGVLAGKVEDSVLININIEGGDITLQGSNFVGGLAGMITGRSIIYGITSNVSAIANVNNGANANMYYNSNDFEQMQNNGYFGNIDYQTYLDNANNIVPGGLSYAGGIAGVIDLQRRGEEEYNLQFITVNQPKTIDADFAGGVAGYFGGGIPDEKIKAKKIKFYTLTTNNEEDEIGGSRIIGGNTAGGLFAVTNAHIEASQVTSVEYEINSEDEYNQYNIDTAISEHVKDTTKELDKTKAGNLSLISGRNYAGGLVGISLGANYNSTYAKAGFNLQTSTNNTIIGGLIGLSINGQVSYSYAIPFINETTNSIKVGGLIGRVYSNKNEQEIASPKEKELDYYTTRIWGNNYNFVAQYTFSTLIKEYSTTFNGKADYFIADSNGVQGGDLISVYVGRNNAFNVDTDNDLSSSSSYAEKELTDLYNTKTDITFDEIFTPYESTTYWNLNNIRYFPLLLDERASNREPISEESDLNKLLANPDGDFKVVNDITIRSKNANYIIDRLFTGSIISETKSGATAVITIEGLNPTNKENAGFFRETQGAQIENLIFNWQGNGDNACVTVQNNNIDVFGGVSAKDNGSTFSQVQVISKNNENTTKLLQTINGRTISGFGGIVGEANNSKIQHCDFDAVVEANVGVLNQGFGNINVGSIAATATSSSFDDTDANNNKISKSLSVSGFTIHNDTSYEIKPSTSSISNANIGLAFGTVSGDNGIISSVGISNKNQLASNKPTLNVNLTSASTISVGGFAGYVIGVKNISDLEIYADINSYSESGKTLQIGGVAGNLSSSNLNQVVAQTNIDAKNVSGSSESEICTAQLSTGVGFASGNVKITNSTFTGEVTSLDEQTKDGDNASNKNKGCDIQKIVAAGVIAEMEGGECTIDTVFANPIINVGNNNAQALHLAGLIANNGSYANLSNVMLGGRLMVDKSNITPTGNEDNDEDNGLYVGGIIANGYKNAITLSYIEVLTTILMDQLNNANAEYLGNVNALFGGNMGDINTEGWVVYSSDMSLVAETLDDTNDNLFNLSARNITAYDNSWLDNTTNFVRSGNGAPYLTNISSQLKSIGILSDNSYNTLQANATQFSPLNPQDLNPTSNEGYRYYLVFNSLSKISSKPFKGVLIGNGEITIDNENVVLIDTIEKHSAISNLHLTLSKDLSISSTEFAGILVKENNGVVSNCSVNGSCSLANSSNFAGLVGTNYGLVQYCYSSAEYRSVNAPFAGLVYTNLGKLAYSYFTGYINSGANDAHGIVYENKDGGYMYNNYMAGVVTNVQNGNSFAASGFDENASNNFIDKNANSETNSGTNDSYLKETSDIMGNIDKGNIGNKKLLQGKWHLIVKQTASNNETTLTLNENSATFGYNYGYPVYCFNKVNNLLDSTIQDKNNQLYTGTGNWEASNDDETTQQRADSLLNNSERYTNAYKISHIGVLQSINMLANKDLNFVIIYDINGKGQTVNSVGKTNCSGFTMTGEEYFTGVVLSNRYYDLTTDESEAESESKVVISNLTTNGLFTNVKNAYIGNIQLAGTFTLPSNINSGVLIANVSAITTDSENSNNNVIIENIDFVEFVENDGENENVKIINQTTQEGDTADVGVGALIGNIGTNAEVGINKLTTSKSVIISGNNSSSGSNSPTNYEGLLVGKNFGIIVYNSKMDLSVSFASGNYAGGLIGYNAGSLKLKLNDTDNTIKIDSGTSGSTMPTATKYLGGVIGYSAHGVIESNSNSIVNLNILLPKQINANNFGGVAANMQGFTAKNIAIVLTAGASTDVMVKDNQKFGGLAAIANDTINISENASFSIAENGSQLTFNVSTTEELNKDTAVGGLFGSISGLTATINFGEININIKGYGDSAASGMSNVGGFVGLATGTVDNVLKTNLSNEDVSVSLNVSGKQNVGGLFGKVEKLVVSGDDNNKYGDYYDASTNDRLNITVNIAENQQNIGGLIGLYKNSDDNSETIGSYVHSTDSGKETKTYKITSSATLHFVGQTSRNYGNYSKNIGGVIGAIQKAGEVANLTYTGTITGDNLNTTYTTTNIKFDEVSNYSFRIINIGGVLGSVEHSTNSSDRLNIYNLENKAKVMGYQNVGGIIGSATNVSIYNKQNTLENADSTTVNNSSAVYGVVNVGGLIGLAKNSIVGAASDNGETTGTGLISTASVYGNYNVGGIVGFAYGASGQTEPGVLNNSIYKTSTPSEDASALEVKGVPYIISNGDKSNKILYKYIPSNVGGVVGFAHTVKISGNNVNSSTVEQTSPLTITSTSESDENSVVISTISNYVGNVLEGNNVSEKYLLEGNSTGVLFNNENNKQAFKTMKSGFGGVAGGVVNLKSDSSNNPNVLNNVSIDAQLGVNVGALYGFVTYTSENNNNDFKSLVDNATISGEIKVDGGYFIGAVAGSVDAGQSIQADGTTAFSNANITAANGHASITLQSKYTGMYVGGLFGKLYAHDNDRLSIVSSDVNIKIDTSKSYYMGGLVGMYYVDKNNTKLTGDVQTQVSTTSYTDAASIGEFGGFIGMLKVEKTNNNGNGGIGVTISNAKTIKPEEGQPQQTATEGQPYAFTVNTIENGNYYDGPSKTEAQKTDEGVDIIAQATYVNQDSFTICPTSNSSWYTKTEDEDTIPNGNNPLKPKASTGWAKEYTMFKTMQRNIPAGTNPQTTSNTSEWDAISVVYDAANVTYVATHSNSKNTLGHEMSFQDYGDDEVRTQIWEAKIEEDNDGNKKYTWTPGDDNGCKLIGDYIIFTIYEAIEGQPVLYSRIGIATPYYDEKGEYATPKSDTSLNSIKDVGIWIAALGLGTDPPTELYALNFTTGIPALDKIQPNGEINAVDDSSKKLTIIGNGTSSQRIYAYEVPKFYQQDEDGTLTTPNKTWFQFDYIYESSGTYTWKTGNESGSEIIDREGRPSSGSVFNVTGVSSDDMNKALAGGGNKFWWSEYVSYAIDAAAIVASFGVGSMIKSGVKGVGKVISKKIAKQVTKKAFIQGGKIVARQTAKMGIGTMLKKTAIRALAGFAGSMLIHNITAGQSSQNYYFEIKDQTIGFLGQSYSREVRYINGKMNSTIYDSYEDYGSMYIYHSTIRPSDYYTNHYYIYYPDRNNNEENVDILPYGVSFDEELVFQTDGEYAGAYKTKYNNENVYVYDYYKYHNNVYYIRMDANEYEFVPEQAYFDFDANEKYLDYINNGNVYIRGSYNDNGYTIEKSNDMNNLLYYKNKGLYRNDGSADGQLIGFIDQNEKIFKAGDYKLKFEASTELHYVPVASTYLLGEDGKDGLYKLDVTNKVLRDNGNDNKDLYYGYGYMKNAYYAPKAAQISYKDKNGNIEPMQAEVGRYTRDNDYKGVEEGVDYVVINGETYKYCDSESNGNPQNYGNIDIYGADGNAVDNIYLNMYPYSFDNKFDGKTYQDKKYYILSSKLGLKEDSAGNPEGLSHTATYFYFDGGYLTGTGEEYGNVIYSELKDVTIPYKYMVDGVEKNGVISLYNDNLHPDNDTDEDTSLQKATERLGLEKTKNEINDAFRYIEIYPGGSDNKTLLTYSEFITGYRNGTYLGYYTMSNSDLEYVTENEKDTYLVSNSYKIGSNNHIYAIDDERFVNGTMVSINIVQPSTGDGAIPYNYNKYCLSADKNIYTRYYYNDTNLCDGNEIKIDDYYYLYRPNYSWPNSGTTYFVESVRVILGGGEKFYDGKEIPNSTAGIIKCE